MARSGRGRQGPGRLVAAVGLVLFVLVALVPAGLALAEPPEATPAVVPSTVPAPPVHYEPPVDAPIADPFRAPATPYGPGNRGVEFTTSAGGPARAAADGTVTFAGPVGGRLAITVLHADGVRTTYVGLASIAVRVGEAVRRGQILATTTERLHVGARRDDVYLDPASLWAAGSSSGAGRGAILVPLDGGG